MTTAHEPRGGPGTHLSAEDLSALAEGAQPSAAGAGEHLRECADCRGEVDAISELLAQFEEWDAPAIPQEVAIRIDAALARESAARERESGHPAAAAVTSPRETSPSSMPAVSVPAADSRRRRRLPVRGLGWALATLVVVGGGLGLALQLRSSGPESAGSSSGAASARGPVAAPPNSSPEYTPYNGQAGGAIPSTPVAPNSPLALWTKATLSSHEGKAGSAVGSPCLSDPAFTGRQLLATSGGTYDGTVSTLVVYANPVDTLTVLAVVYATPCTTTNYRVLARGLVTR